MKKKTYVRRNKITYLQHKQDEEKIQIRGNTTHTHQSQTRWKNNIVKEN